MTTAPHLCAYTPCAAAFTPPPSAPHKQYCARRCKERAAKARRLQANLAQARTKANERYHRRRQGIDLRCAECGQPRPTHRGKYCDDECATTAQKRRLKQRAHDRYRRRVPLLPVRCPVCSEMFVPNVKGRMYCDKRCTQRAQYRRSVGHPIADVDYAELGYRPGQRLPIGTVTKNAAGYLKEKTGDGPDGWPLQHRLVMSRHLGRPLLDDEIVHHRNGNIEDNDISNLELCRYSQPPVQRVIDMIEWMRSYLADYGLEVVGQAPLIDQR